MIRPGLTFSHMGVYVTDLDRMEDFYTRVFGFTVTDRGQLPGPEGPVNLVFLSRDPDEHHQIVLATGRPDTINYNPINQISLKADCLTTLKQVYAAVKNERHPTVIEPMTHGNALSVYVRDPDGNRLELFIDLPWYVTQPHKVPVDLGASNDEIMATAEAHARSLPGFRMRSEWRAEMAGLMGIG